MNMFEVIYISPSYKQAGEFIDKLMWELRKHDIYDAEINRERLQIKTDKFIVSTINIFGGNLGASWYYVKYYIDKVSDTKFPYEKSKENALESLKYLRCRFRESTKEISEEELIDVLVREYK